MSKKTIGILGGMGPAATADLFTKIINSTEAGCDQEHLHVIIDSNTNIPDRTEALIHGGADPTEQMTQSARRLAEAGAELIVMPCNTAHGFYDAVCASVTVPVLHMIKLTAARRASRYRRHGAERNIRKLLCRKRHRAYNALARGSGRRYGSYL